MNNTTTSASQKLGFQSINFSDLSKFNSSLELDEIVLMQYLIYHCNTNSGTWFHSAADIETGLKIKKHRFKSIIDDFERKGWVKIKKGGPKNRRCFQVNFEKLCSLDFLNQYYNYPNLTELEQNHVSEVFIEYLKNYRCGHSRLMKLIRYASPDETYENLLVLIEREYYQLKSANRLVEFSEISKLNKSAVLNLTTELIRYLKSVNRDG